MEMLKHLFSYFVLVLGLLVSFLAFFLLMYNPTYQFYAILGGVVWYVLWGIIHHYAEGRLTSELAFEYILIGGLVLLLFGLVLKSL